MPRFMARCPIDKTKLELIKDIVDKTEQSAVSTINMFYNQNENKIYCILDAPNENAIKSHYASANIACDFITPIELVHTQNEENSEKLEIIGELSTKLTHDIRNPLAIIKNIVEIMETKQNLDIEERDIYYQRLHRAVNRISYQIEDVLNFVRPTRTNFKRHLLNDIIASAVEKIVKSNTIKIKMPVNFVYAVCDFTKLEVAFTNLIMNAVQAINDFGQIEIKLVDGDDSISIQVSDTGCGIQEDILPKIFEPLFTTKQTGTGLGLPSCKQIIEHHNGTIKASSTVGIGTTFTVTLPKNCSVPQYVAKTELLQAR